MWEIADNNGTLYQGTREEIQLIWDLIFRDSHDLAGEYRQKYSINEIKRMKREYHNIEWTGKLKLIQIHEQKKKSDPRLRSRSYT